MYFPTRSLFLFILVVVQIINVLGQVDVYEVLPAIPNTPLNEYENKEVSTDEDKPSEESKNFVDETAIKFAAANSTVTNTTKANCLMDKVYGPVEIVNAIRLMKLLITEPDSTNRSRNDKEGRQQPGTCVLVLFYARWCIFSSQAAPHFNALPRTFPHIKAVAIDAIKYQNFNVQYGIVGVPTLMLVHNGKPVATFNGTVYTLEYFAQFIKHFTNLEQYELLYVTSLDFGGPVPSTPSNETDYYLLLSWIFIAACALHFISQSRWWQQFKELVQNTWRESNAQHEHAD